MAYMRLFSCCLFLLSALHTSAQITGGQHVFQFLRLSPSARITALGGSQIAVQDDDPGFAALNPAALNPSMAGQIALQHLQNYHFYKLPGGGVDQGETVEKALVREVKEEVGCDCEIIRPVGVVIEYRAKYKLLHLNYCFVAKVTSAITETAFEEAEIKAGQTNIWVAPESVLEIVRSGKCTNYESHFNIPRELTFLEEYLQTKNR
jgi:ADP-ribose pyrophosphatase YjhB (NUDIX family)